jgi:replicative DNA helicase
MATPEHRLLSRIIQQVGALEEVLAYGIVEDDFINIQCRAIWQMILGYFKSSATRGSVMSEDAFRNEFSHFELVEAPNMTVAALCHDLRNQRLTLRLKEAAVSAVELADSDPMAAAAALKQAADTVISYGHSACSDVRLSSHMGQLIQNYEMKESGLIQPVVHWPWAPLDEEVGGISEEDYILLWGRPKCVPVGTPLLTPSGEFVPIEKCTRVFGVSHDTQKMGARVVTGCSDVVNKNVVEVVTRTGKRMLVGEDHPLLRPDLTYTEARHLRAGDYVGVARTVRTQGTPGDTDYYELLGLLTGDGGFTTNHVTFTNTDKGILQRVQELVFKRGCSMQKIPSSVYDYSITNKKGAKNPVLETLRQEHLFGCKSEHKRVPPSLLSKNTVCVSAYLGGLLSTDGGVYKTTVRWNTSSSDLARSIQHLLLRLGVTGALGEVTTNIGTTAYTVNVQSQEQHVALLRHLRPYISCEHKLLALVDNCERKILRKRQDDGVPFTSALHSAIHAAKNKKGAWPKVWKSKFDRSKLFRRSGSISRALLRTLAKELDAPELLVWADGDVRWEAVLSVKDVGVLPCVDISVSGDHNFLVGDVFTHNSMKTFVLNYAMSHFYLEQGKRILCYTKEMSPTNMLLRISSFICALPYRETRLGKLSKGDKATLLDLERIVKEREAATQGRNDLIILSGQDAAGHDGVTWLQSKIKQHKPDICCVDGLYLLNDDRSSKKTADWQRVMHISRDVRQMILETHVPVIATMQANRAAAKNSGAELDEIAFADAVGQDITQGFRVINEKNSPTIALIAGGSREYELHGVRINGVPCTDFSFHSIMTDKEIEKSAQEDTSEEDAPQKQRKPPRKLKSSGTADAQMDEAIRNHI